MCYHVFKTRKLISCASFHSTTFSLTPAMNGWLVDVLSIQLCKGKEFTIKPPKTEWCHVTNKISGSQGGDDEYDYLDVSPCSLVELDRRFRDAYFLHHHSALMMKSASAYRTSVNVRVHQPSGATLQKTAIFILTKPTTNQPKELTKGGVLRRRTTSSLARLNHSCWIWKGTVDTISGDMLTLTGLLSWLRALTCSN
jgi:hypothetical protein